MRIEEDALGTKEISDDCYYGIHTSRALENFSLNFAPLHPELIQALALVKKAAAESNGELRFLDRKVAEAISNSCDEIMAGQLDQSFPLDALQGGAGTSTNMNMNEVLANRSLEKLGYAKGRYDIIHPIHHVNLHQSTNDVYPTALRIAAIRLILKLSEACSKLQETLQNKEQEFAHVLKVGRTEMQDAVPVMLGQEFGAYAQAIARDRWRLYKAEERLRQINLGGTAIGTGMNNDRKYLFLVNEKIRAYTGLGLARAEDMIDGTQNADVFVEVSGLLKALAVNLQKISADLRLLSSGPKAGFGEIKLPKLQAGSSIMPGKVNPVMTECMTQVAFEVMASDLAITLAAQGGQLELNAFLPLIAHRLLNSMSLLIGSIDLFTEKAIAGIQANEEKCQQWVKESLIVVTALVPYIGYDEAAKIAEEALEQGKSIEEIVLQQGIMTEDELQQKLTPQKMTRPGRK